MGPVVNFFLIGSLLLEATMAAKCTRRYPINAICGMQGSLRHYHSGYTYFGEPSLVGSVEECALLCSRRVVNRNQRQSETDYGPGYCNSFDFDLDTGFCQLLYQPVHPKRIVPGGNHTFFSHRCYDCGDICDQPIGLQLLDNGGFDNDEYLVGPWYTLQGGNSFKGRTSKHAFSCRYPTTGSYNDACFAAQTLNLCYEQLYAISFWYHEKPNITSYYHNEESMSAGLGDTGNTRAQSSYFSVSRKSKYPSTETPWKKVTLYYRKLPKKGFSGADPLSFGIQDEGYVIDDVKVARIDPNPIVEPRAEEVFRNGGFETDNFSSFHAPYAKARGISVSSPGINSTYALKINGSDFFYYNIPVILTQSLNTTAGTVYLFTMDINLTTPKFVNHLFSINTAFGNGDSRIGYESEYAAGNYTLSTPIFALHDQTHFSLSINGMFNTLVLDNLSLKKLVTPSV